MGRSTPPNWISQLFPPNTKRTVSPPGSLTAPSQKLPLIVVASFPRSGTHLLIDLILNNFPAYRRAPLYVNLDEYLEQGLSIDSLLETGTYLVKTHFPEPSFSAADLASYERVFSNSILVAPRRDEVGLVKSYQRMLDVKRKSEVRERHADFWNYWGSKHTCIFDFDAIIDPARTEEILDQLSVVLEIPRAERVIGPPNKKNRFSIYCRKLATRIMGNHLSNVNTTVGFDRR
jgi:hypothetical protein